MFALDDIMLRKCYCNGTRKDSAKKKKKEETDRNVARTVVLLAGVNDRADRFLPHVILNLPRMLHTCGVPQTLESCEIHNGVYKHLTGVPPLVSFSADISCDRFPFRTEVPSPVPRGRSRACGVSILQRRTLDPLVRDKNPPDPSDPSGPFTRFHRSSVPRDLLES